MTDESNGYADYAKPLREERDRLAAHLENLEAERDDLRSRIRHLNGAIEHLDPDPERKKPGPRKGAKKYDFKGATQDRALAEVTEWLEKHSDKVEEGFTFTGLFDMMRANGSQAHYGKERIRHVVNELHERGVIVLSHRTVGGGKSYKLVKSDG